MPEVFEGTVIALSSEGQGIVRHENLVIFIPFSCPGDKIQYQIVRRKKNFAHGLLVKVLVPASVRTLPLCRYYGQCGGCQLQHMNYEAQLLCKRQTIEEAFKRIGKIPYPSVQPVIPAKLDWAYRRHVTLKIFPENSTLAAGYTKIDHHSLLKVEHCPIFISEDNPAIQDVQDILKLFSSQGFPTGTATIFKSNEKAFILKLSFEKKALFQPEGIENFLKRHPYWQGVLIIAGDKRWIFGQVQTFLELDDMRFICSPEVFIQNHPEQSLKIYRKIIELASLKPCFKVFDLYCGIGISSLLLAKHGHIVTGIEFNPQSINFAKENAKANQLENVQFLQGDVEKIIYTSLKKEKADLILVNPPRVGMTNKVIESILKHQPKSIIYISCMPSTLARDLQTFCQDDYKIEFIQPYDMFPQTYHVETLVYLERK